MKMAGAEKEEFLLFLAELYLIEPDYIDFQNNRNLQHKTLDWMCWIQNFFGIFGITHLPWRKAGRQKQILKFKTSKGE